MKLSEVAIQAFRIYDKVDDGTFDFHTDSGEVADFVSIFAPNGFGKTSFYDAIEWGFTNQVHRLSSEREWIEKDRLQGRRNGSTRGRDILRNKASDPSIKTRVTIGRDNGADIYNEITRSPKSSSTDIDLGEKGDPSLQPFFRKVLLEQEAIDAFLRVVKPAEKYAEWASYFSDENTEKYYKTIWNLAMLNDERITALEKKRKDLRAPGAALDSSLLERLNEQIIAIRSHDPDLPLVDETFDTVAWQKFTSRINELRVDTQASQKVLERRLDDIQTAISGGNKIVGVKTYLEIPDAMEKNTTELRSMRTYEKVFEAIAADEESSTDLRNEISDRRKDLDRFQKLLKRFPAFSSSKKAIDNAYASIAKATAIIQSNLDTRTKIDHGIIIAESSIAELERSQGVLRSNIDRVPETTEEVKKLEIEVERLQKEADVSREEVKRLRTKELTPLASRSAYLDRTLTAIGDSNFQIKVEKEVRDNFVLLRRLNLDESRFAKELAAVERKIGSLSSLSSDVESLVRLGLDVVRSTIGSNCPLCQYDHGTHKHLLESLQSSSVLTTQADDLSKAKGQLNRKIKEIRRTISQLKSETSKILEVQKTQVQAQISKTEEAISQLTSELQQSGSELLDVRGRLDVLRSAFLGLEPARFLNQERQKLESLAPKIKAEKRKHDVLRKEASQINQTIALEENRIHKDRKSLSRLEKDTSYSRFIDDAADQSIDISSSVGLETKIRAVINKISEIEKYLSAITKRIDDAKKSLPKITAGTVAKKIDALTDRTDELRSKKAAFEEFLSQKLALVLNNKKRLPQMLKKGRAGVQSDIESSNRLLGELEKVRLNEASIKPYLEYWSIEHSRRSIEDRLARNSRLKSSLEAEQQQLSEQLEESVKDFFDEDLINSIYRAIDPHPVYDTVKFVCKFQEREPTLDVIVQDKNDSAVPNLYFSAAQINVLSLSIFLARALKAVNDDDAPIRCIFVDDPVQSMDSINVLSTIDLFRSIVLNQKIQIILSTHDENFHNLLRRKIPKDRFKSQFIELETYGKVGSRVTNPA